MLHRTERNDLVAQALVEGRMGARFWSKVDRAGPTPSHAPELGPCWIWMAAKTAKGYGKFSLGHSHWESAHRIAFALDHGAPAQLLVCHRCDNPSCVRPDHLYDGSVKDNAKDAWVRGRNIRFHPNRPKRAQHGRAKLTEADVALIRSTPKRYGACVALAARFGVSASLIRQIRRGVIWR